MSLEQKYTSTETKMMHNLDKLILIQKGVWRPASIQFAPTDKCNLDCDFCSVKERDGDEIYLDDAKKALLKFKNLGARTVEFTGGGDPTMYKGINELIEFSDTLGYKIGMITNGVTVKKNITKKNLDKLTWLRISLNSLDYVQDIDVPEIKGTLGFSYVWNARSDRKKLDKIKEYKDKYNAKFVRVVPNCLTYELIDQYKKDIKPIVDEYKDFFFQTKEYSKPERCWIGYLKPFVAPDGYIYRCSAIPLIKQKFDPEWRMGHISDIDKIWNDVKPYSTEKCDKCFFKVHNDIIENTIRECEHEYFL
jgi:MoaA/NifB/PqqE/SkfB family radical SAM enzyme